MGLFLDRETARARLVFGAASDDVGVDLVVVTPGAELRRFLTPTGAAPRGVLPRLPPGVPVCEKDTGADLCLTALLDLIELLPLLPEDTACLTLLFLDRPKPAPDPDTAAAAAAVVSRFVFSSIEEALREALSCLAFSAANAAPRL